MHLHNSYSSRATQKACGVTIKKRVQTVPKRGLETMTTFSTLGQSFGGFWRVLYFGLPSATIPRAPTQLLLVSSYTEGMRRHKKRTPNRPKTWVEHFYNILNICTKFWDDSEKFCTLVCLLPPFPGHLYSFYSFGATQQACSVTNENSSKSSPDEVGILKQYFKQYFKVLHDSEEFCTLDCLLPPFQAHLPMQCFGD